jgi:hypothetical protein
MNPQLAAFVQEARKDARFRSPGTNLREVLNTPLRGWAWVDAAVVAGDLRLRQVLDDHVDASQIPEGIHAAYAAQYPVHSQSESLVEFLRRHSHDPDALRGAMNGIKGKYFEMEYVEHLNNGHLPAGYSAVLAGSANNPGYDISILDGNGELVDQLNAKVNASVSVVIDHIERYPGVDIVTTSEAAERVIAAGVDGAVVLPFGSVDAVNETMEGAVGAVTDGLDGILGLPLLSLGFMSATAYRRLRQGDDPVLVWKLLSKRILVLGVASGAAHAMTVLCGEPLIGAPTAATVYVLVGRAGNHSTAAEGIIQARLNLKDLAEEFLGRR